MPVAQRDATDTYSISRRVLKRIDDEKLVKTFTSVVGPELMHLLRETTDALGEKLGAGHSKPASVPGSTAIQEQLVRFGRKVGAYCRALAVNVNDEDLQSVERFVSAVKPIDDLRASARTGGSADTQPSAPTTTPSAPVTNGASNGASTTPHV